MIKRILSVLLVCGIMASLCGCHFFTADTAELLSPPELSGELYPIAKAINASAGGEYTLKYPSRGNYRSAVVREDVDNDGILEAFAFYGMIDGENVIMNINLIRNDKNGWNSVSIQKIVAGGVDKIEFCDLDGDGHKEIMVGWEIYGTSEMQLAVYDVGKTTLTQRMLQKYTHFTTCDLDENDKNEILVIKTATTEQQNSASLFELTKDGVSEISSCELDSAAKTLNEPVVATLSTGRPAVYIDEIKGVGAITEVLFFEGGALVNPLFSSDTRETTATLRPISFKSKDVNGDSIIEIPVQENVPSVTRGEVNEKLYLTNWSSFNGEKLTTQLTAMINVNDGYSLVLPKKWVGKIAVLKDTDNQIREVYRYNPEDMSIGESLFYIKAVKKASWDKGKYDKEEAFEIVNNGETSYICKIFETAIADGFTTQIVKGNFAFIE